MKHRTVFYRTVENWRLHGLPRCAAWFPIDEKSCRGLIWPWQRAGGNGEDAEHYDCMLKERAQHEESDRLEDLEDAA